MDSDADHPPLRGDIEDRQVAETPMSLEGEVAVEAVEAVMAATMTVAEVAMEDTAEEEDMVVQVAHEAVRQGEEETTDLDHDHTLDQGRRRDGVVQETEREEGHRVHTPAEAGVEAGKGHTRGV